MPTKAALFRNIRRAISQIVVCGGPQMKSPPFIITGSSFFRQEIPPSMLEEARIFKHGSKGCHPISAFTRSLLENCFIFRVRGVWYIMILR